MRSRSSGFGCDGAPDRTEAALDVGGMVLEPVALHATVGIPWAVFGALGGYLVDGTAMVLSVEPDDIARDAATP